MTTSSKLAAITALAMLAASAAPAFAGDGKNCDHKKKAAMKTEAAANGTAVLAATDRTTIKGAKTVMTFDEALNACQTKGAADLQACIDYKTGKVSAMKKAPTKSYPKS